MSDAEYRVRNDPVIKAGLEFARWWFDVLRSFFVVVLLAYVGHKTESAVLKLIGYLSFALFGTYVIAHIMDLAYFPKRLANARKSQVARTIILVTSSIILVGITYLAYGQIFLAFDQVLKFQLK